MRLQATRRSRTASDNGIAELERKAAEAAGLLKLLANENRLLILCRLVVAGEMSVGDLADAVELEPVGAVSTSRQDARRWPRRHAARSADGFLPYRRSKRGTSACAAQEHLLPLTGRPNQKRRKISWLICKPYRPLAPLSLYVRARY